MYEPRNFPGLGCGLGVGIATYHTECGFPRLLPWTPEQRVRSRLSDSRRLQHFSSASIFVIGGTALSATVLHGIEGSIWAGTYRLLGALPDIRSATLYSLSAMTSYGHADLYLEPRWQMLGALEALNGMILFGLTTAFLFTVLQRAWLQT